MRYQAYSLADKWETPIIRRRSRKSTWLLCRRPFRVRWLAPAYDTILAGASYTAVPGIYHGRVLCDRGRTWLSLSRSSASCAYILIPCVRLVLRFTLYTGGHVYFPFFCCRPMNDMLTDDQSHHRTILFLYETHRLCRTGLRSWFGGELLIYTQNLSGWTTRRDCSQP